MSKKHKNKESVKIWVELITYLMGIVALSVLIIGLVYAYIRYIALVGG